MKSKKFKTVIMILSLSVLLIVPIIGTYCFIYNNAYPDLPYIQVYTYDDSGDIENGYLMFSGGHLILRHFKANTTYTIWYTNNPLIGSMNPNTMDDYSSHYAYFNVSGQSGMEIESNAFTNDGYVRFKLIDEIGDIGYNYVTFTTNSDTDKWDNATVSGGTTLNGYGLTFGKGNYNISGPMYSLINLSELHIIEGTIDDISNPSYSLGNVNNPEFDIPGGTMLVLDFGNNPSAEEVALTTTTTISSPLFGAWQTGAKEMHPSSLNRTFSYNYISEQADMITWSKADKNILGQTKHAFHNSVISGTSARYYVLINPKAVNIENRDEWIDLAPIHVQVFGSIQNAYTFKLNQNWYNIVPDLDSPDSSRILYDNNGELEWRTSSELTASNVESGGVTSESIGAVATTIPTQSGTTSSSDDTGIVGSISGLLESGANNVNTLSNNSRGFMSGLATLYSYLPEDLLALILTTLTVVVIVCIFKLFI